MRHSNSRRSRGGRNNNSNSGRRNNNQRTQTFDSNGPDVRIRGNAFQVNEKYEALARDAAAAGDAVLAESYRQHAEHYQRVINDLTGGNNNSKDNNQSRKKSNGATDNNNNNNNKQEADGNKKDDAKANADSKSNDRGRGKQGERHPQRQPRNVKKTQQAEPVEA